MKISFIIPSRNNLKYLKWSYASIRNNQGNHDVEICVADDNSDDGTWDWCQEVMVSDSRFKAIRNDSGERLGHTILYDRLINEVATEDICMIFDADMYLAKGALDAIEKHMFTIEKVYGEKSKVHGKESTNDPVVVPEMTVEVKRNYKTIVSLTRVEPPLHPEGPEKIIKDFGIEPEKFIPSEFDTWVDRMRKITSEKITHGIFAPWAFWKKDFVEIGGHDILFAPQSKEDSDLFNRFHLNGIKFVQTWEGFVYHMTCRGSRFNPNLTQVGTASDEWKAQNIRSSRNFIRKWGHYVKHDPHMKPIIPPKYDVGLVIHNCNIDLLRALEPWCSNIYVDLNEDVVDTYIEEEQKNTSYDLYERVLRTNIVPFNNIVVVADGRVLSQADANYIQLLSEILHDSGVEGETMGIGSLKINIKSLETHEQELIKCKE